MILLKSNPSDSFDKNSNLTSQNSVVTGRRCLDQLVCLCFWVTLALEHQTFLLPYPSSLCAVGLNDICGTFIDPCLSQRSPPDMFLSHIQIICFEKLFVSDVVSP